MNRDWNLEYKLIHFSISDDQLLDMNWSRLHWPYQIRLQYAFRMKCNFQIRLFDFVNWLNKSSWCFVCVCVLWFPFWSHQIYTFYKYFRCIFTFTPLEISTLVQIENIDSVSSKALFGDLLTLLCINWRRSSDTCNSIEHLFSK